MTHCRHQRQRRRVGNAATDHSDNRHARIQQQQRGTEVPARLPAASHQQPIPISNQRFWWPADEPTSRLRHRAGWHTARRRPANYPPIHRVLKPVDHSTCGPGNRGVQKIGANRKRRRDAVQQHRQRRHQPNKPPPRPVSPTIVPTNGPANA